MIRTPASLLERLRQPDDPEAWRRFVEIYTPLIYSWGRRIGLQDPDAADLVQEVFVILVEVLPTFSYDRQKSFGRWLHTVTLNKWRDRSKRAENRMRPEPEGQLDQVEASAELEVIWEAEYQQHLAAQALRIMQADFHETTWKACWETVAMGRSVAEVAAELGLTIGAVYAARFRVLARLYQELKGLLD